MSARSEVFWRKIKILCRDRDTTSRNKRLPKPRKRSYVMLHRRSIVHICHNQMATSLVNSVFLPFKNNVRAWNMCAGTLDVSSDSADSREQLGACGRQGQDTSPACVGQ